MEKRRKTWGDVAAMGTVGLLMGALAVPAVAQLARSRELANRAACAANIRGLAQSMIVYAADNGDLYPDVGGKSNVTYDASVKGEVSDAKTADDAIASIYQKGLYPNNPMASMWLMVLKGQVAPKGFICKSDPFADVPSPQQDKDKKYLLNFSSAKAVSYSMAYPWAGVKDGKAVLGEWMKNTSDSSLPILSDVAPYMGTKAAAGEATTIPAGPPAGPATARGYVAGGAASAPAGGAAAPGALVGPARAASPNHQLDGENVAFADSHVEFFRRADVAPNNDNIWTEKVNGKETVIEAGTLPQGLPARMPFDTVMVPMRSSKGELK